MLWLRHCDRITDGLRLTAIHSLTFVCGRYQHHALCAMWSLDGFQLTSASLRAFGVLSVSLCHSHSSKPNPNSFFILRAYLSVLYDYSLIIRWWFADYRSMIFEAVGRSNLVFVGEVGRRSTIAKPRLWLFGLVLLSRVTPPLYCLRKQDCSTRNRFQR
jgi:hypothetical protein